MLKIQETSHAWKKVQDSIARRITTVKQLRGATIVYSMCIWCPMFSDYCNRKLLVKLKRLLFIPLFLCLHLCVMTINKHYPKRCWYFRVTKNSIWTVLVDKLCSTSCRHILKYIARVPAYSAAHYCYYLRRVAADYFLLTVQCMYVHRRLTSYRGRPLFADYVP